MKRKGILLTVGLLFSVLLLAQHHPSITGMSSEENEWPNFRQAIVIGHTLIPVEATHDHIFIPSWGIDTEYWPSRRWGVGLHADIEIESFIILVEGGESVERINPVVVTLDALHRLKNGLIIVLGPGIELEQSREYALFRLGLEYEIPLGYHFDLAPTVFYDRRFDGYATWTVGLGVGKRF